MPSAEYNTTPREIRNFATLQLGLTGAFLIALYWLCGGTDAGYPPPWLAALLVVPIVVAAVLAERVWLSAKPLAEDADTVRLRATALDVYASQTVRKMLIVEASMLPGVFAGFVGPYDAWPVIIVGFPGILLLAWEIWPTLRNVSRTAAMLDSGGVRSGLVDGFESL